MRAPELRGKTEKELKEELSKLRNELSELRIKKRTDGLEDPNVLKKKRQEIARLMTVIREKEILG